MTSAEREHVADERERLRRLREGDEHEFMRLVEELGPSMLRVARLYVRTRAVAEEVVQEAWLGVLNGLDRFEGRSSLKTWIFRILTNTAKTRGVRESRSLPFSAFADDGDDEAGPSVDPDRFFQDGEFVGHWASPPSSWSEPAERLEASETRSVIEQAIASLPESQRTVITLRDVEGWSADEVCNALDVSETNQRVLLHRARTKVRRALDEYLDQGVMRAHDDDFTCTELVELVTDYLDGALDPVERERFERHLVYCTGCAVYLEQIRATVALSGGLTEDDLSEEAKTGLLAAFRDWKRG